MDDRFSQYGIKVSVWGSGTLKVVIYVENLTTVPTKGFFSRVLDIVPKEKKRSKRKGPL